MRQPRRRRNPAQPQPVAKRGRQNQKYRTRQERELFELGNRATFKETT